MCARGLTRNSLYVPQSGFLMHVRSANDRVERAKRANNVEAGFACRALSLERRRGQFSARRAKRDKSGARRCPQGSRFLARNHLSPGLPLSPDLTRFTREGNLFNPLAPPWAAKSFFFLNNYGAFLFQFSSHSFFRGKRTCSFLVLRVFLYF